ncbi:MAG: hypothetical protein CVV23_16465 [Ignavibacteriae bacterium HGW-Ignavibacteriae-2]|jgi:hypothetical protein|nr:hypothetical protein [Bacteroidota bacterium]PKL87220.1 MAG: hypothetical protein CVV23_16465 [Ignavibacteriae bacterium HGW-Ignavibacteriae-2]
MKKSFVVSFILISIISSNFIYSQNFGSFEISGGLVLQSSASNGFNTTIQYNHRFNDDIQFYIYSGYTSWNEFYVTFTEELTPPQKETIFKAYTQDNHILIPIYFGSRVNLQTNKLFTAFASFEIGYSYLNYNSYQVKKIIDPANGVVISYQPDINTKKEVKENLLGIGLGAGITREITKAINIVLFYKINSQINSEYYDALSSKATFSAINLGINVVL